MTRQKPHKWIFTARFRRNAYGWRGSRLACKRIKEAVSEIRKVARKDPLLGVEEQVRKDIHEIVNLNGSADTFVKDVLRRHF